jgi:hypothetical protein
MAGIETIQDLQQLLPDSTRPLTMVIFGEPYDLPVNTDQLIKEIGTQPITSLIESLIELGVTDNQIFADACALATVDQLPERTLAWFEQKGLCRISNGNIRVHLRHKHEFVFVQNFVMKLDKIFYLEFLAHKIFRFHKTLDMLLKVHLLHALLLIKIHEELWSQ